MQGDSFEKSINLPKITLELSGIQIFSKKEKGFVLFIKSWIIYFNLSFLIPHILGELYWLIEGVCQGKSLDELFMNAPCSTVNILSSVKLICLYYNRAIVNNIVDKLRDMHPMYDDENISNKERRILKNSMRFLSIVVRFFCYSGIAVVIAFSTAPALSMAYNYPGYTELKLPLRVKYFFRISTVSRWAVVYIHQIGTMLISCVNLVSADILFYTLCTYVQIHFRLLCRRFENAVSKISATETRENFRLAIRRHLELIQLVDQIELLYSTSILCNIILSSLLICLSGFIVTLVHDVDAVSSFIIFLVTSLTQVTLLCFFGDMLNSASIQVSDAIFSSCWYDAELHIKKSVLIVLIRAQRPCKITAMKFADLNLNALSAILKTSWSYFALLKTMYD